MQSSNFNETNHHFHPMWPFLRVPSMIGHFIDESSFTLYVLIHFWLLAVASTHSSSSMEVTIFVISMKVFNGTV